MFVYFTHTPSSVIRTEGMCCKSVSHSIYMLLCLLFLGSFRIHCICTLNTELFAKSLVFCVYLGAPASLAIGDFIWSVSRESYLQVIPAGCVPYCTGSQTERLLCIILSQDLWGESFAAWMHVCVQWLIQPKRLHSGNWGELMFMLGNLYSAKRDLAEISLPGVKGGNVPLLFCSQTVSRGGD